AKGVESASPLFGRSPTKTSTARSRQRTSGCPVFHFESRHLGEVYEVPGKQRRVQREGNRGDLEVHRADPDARTPQSLVFGGGLFIKRQDRNVSIVVQMP